MCSEPDPLLLLRLYPSLLPDKFLPLLPSSAYGEPLPDMPAAAAAAETSSSSSSSVRLKGGGAADVAGAVGVVVPYLLSHRTRLLASLEEAAAAAAAVSNKQQQQQQQGQELTNGEAAAATGSRSSRQRSKQELELVAAVIDTAILRAMLLQPDSGALLRLLQQTNFVDLEDGEAVLTAAGRYAELAALYQYNR
jgi:hypothetical protein